MKNSWYPLKFHPIYKAKIWGGQKLKTHLHKPITATNIGESWEISDVDDNTSIVSNGSFSGQSLSELTKAYQEDFLGAKNYEQFKNTFPLLIKFIDAKDDLSVQVHPNDILAAEHHNTFGKTEMWYVMQADEGSELIVGFNQKVDSDLYLKHLEQQSLMGILNFDKAKQGDTYFIEVGRIHAISGGVLLAEIQQTSDITYRVFDWDRVDENGQKRELHNELAIKAINFDLKDDFKIDYDKAPNQANSIVSCPYFTTNYLKVEQTLEKENTYDSFIIYICVSGNATIKVGTHTETIQMGETVLLPAAIKTFEIISKNATLLEVYV